MAQSNRNIQVSVGRIKKQVPGCHLETVGSACVVEFPGDYSANQASTSVSLKDQTFLVTTSQVIKKSELLSSKNCTADFSPVKWGGIQTFRLNSSSPDDVQEACIPGEHEISLIYIPTQPFHKQKFFSWLFSKDNFQSNRSQLCYKGSCQSGSQAFPGSKPEFYCYVLHGDKPGDKFDLRCYALEVDQSRSYYLQVLGNKAKLRRLEDFSRHEYPKGSVILNEKEEVVGFLAFGEDDKIVPVFFPQDRLQGENQIKDQLLAPKDSESTEGTSDSEANGDVKKDKENNLYSDSFRNLPDNLKNKDVWDPDEDLQIRTDNSRQPAELSYHSMTGREQARTTGTDTNDDHQARTPFIGRTESAVSVTPKFGKRVFKSYYSEVELVRLKQGAKVEEAILSHVYIKDALTKCLDTSYIRNNENWQHLAYRQKVSADLIMKLRCQSPESRSEGLFQLLKTSSPDLTFGTLKRCLLDLEKMTNVLECIKNFPDDKNFAEELESGKVPGRFLILLDQKPEKDWNTLGDKLGVESSTLEGIKVDCATRHQNPAQDIIELICASDPTMTIGQFKKHLENIKREDVKRILNNHPGLEKLTIVALRDNLDLMREVTRLLNLAHGNKQIKNFTDLAEECGIPAEKYRNLQPPCTESPTEGVLQDIVGRKPSYTVRELFIDLREMNRKDAIEAISIYFVEDDIRALKRELKISPE